MSKLIFSKTYRSSYQYLDFVLITFLDFDRNSRPYVAVQTSNSKRRRVNYFYQRASPAKIFFQHRVRIYKTCCWEIICCTELLRILLIQKGEISHLQGLGKYISIREIFQMHKWEIFYWNRTWTEKYLLTQNCETFFFHTNNLVPQNWEESYSYWEIFYLEVQLNPDNIKFIIS